jgi:hypothetical protein
VPDEVFGYMLQPVDLAMNKVMAATGRRKLRDIVEIASALSSHLPNACVTGLWDC